MLTNKRISKSENIFFPRLLFVAKMIKPLMKKNYNKKMDIIYFQTKKLDLKGL